MVHQHFKLVPSFTIAENIMLGIEPNRSGFIDGKAEAESVRKLAESFGLPVNPNLRVREVSGGEQQRVEILKILQRNAQVLILDEPTAVLTPQEVHELLTVVRKLAQTGRTILLITHKLIEVKEVADRVTIMRRGRLSACGRVLRFWGLAWLGNLMGAIAVGWLVHVAQDYPPDVTGLLGELVDRKMAYRREGGASSWGELILSGALANWLVGMAAFFAVMGRTLIGKYIPVFLAVTLFVSANLQHSPANMGYFSLITPGGDGPGWQAAMLWNVIPVGIGNIIGGSLLVVLPFWFAQRRQHPLDVGPGAP